MKDRVFPDFKVPTPRWWERIILWFLPVKVSSDRYLDHATILKYKTWRGKTYILDSRRIYP